MQAVIATAETLFNLALNSMWHDEKLVMLYLCFVSKNARACPLPLGGVLARKNNLSASLLEFQKSYHKNLLAQIRNTVAKWISIF